MLRRRFTLQGQVQGVGFRPFVYALALESSLSGFVRNSSEGVVVEVQGAAKALEAFAHGLETRLPPLARVTGKKIEELVPLGEENSFTILSSEDTGSGHAVLVSPDMALCADCAADMSEPANRRYLYPFTNCTNCGPRYTITRSIPYDRAFTSMACFPMCPDCRAEYENPANRRFHAQPNACPVCGPKVWFVSKEDVGKGADASAPPFPHLSALSQTAALLRGGGVAAIKGLGGFHLACDALNEEAVSRLRRLKERPHKPFALMVRDLEMAGRLAYLGEKEAALLHSPEHPIVLCRCRENSPIAPSCSPDTAMVGLMLPYTPLHEALFALLAGDVPEPGGITALVMTSGNPGGEPICLGNREAIAGLAHMADGFLLHDRDILIRVDDSVVCPLGKQTLFYRRARGYVPSPVPLGALFFNKPEEAGKAEQSGIEGMPETAPDAAGSVPAESAAVKRSDVHRALSDKLSTFPALPGSATDPVVLGVGAELKNTFCLTKKTDAFVSQHIGDMGNLETADFHRRMIGHLSGLLQVRPDVVVRDLHPDFLSSVYARETGLPVLALQHHYAHAHAVLAEHQYLEAEGFPPALVLALDGTGLGEDGTLWGGELLLVDALGKSGKTRAGHVDGQKRKAAVPVSGPVHARLGHIAPMLLPGGDAAVREPWRIAHALLESLGLLASTTRPLPWMPEYEASARFIPAMIARRLNSPESTSCGRLFDAVAALLGLCNATSYEGQAAIRLEEAQYGSRLSTIRFAHDKNAALQDDFDISSEEAPTASASLSFEGDAAYLCPVLSPDSGRGSWQLDTHSLFRALWQDWQAEIPVPVLARRFHASLAQGLADLAAVVAQERGLRHVGLSGGCMQNKTLALMLSQRLRQKGLEPLLHRYLPPNDACISLGQAAWGLLAVTRGVL